MSNDEDKIKRNMQKIKTYNTKKETEIRRMAIREDIIRWFEGGQSSGYLMELCPPEATPISKFKELIENKKFSAITMTYKPEYQTTFTEEDNRKILKNAIKTISFNHDIPIEIVLLPDCDEGGNFHYHGIVSMPIKYRPRFKKEITKYIGFMKLKYIDNIEKWTNYCFKVEEPIYTNEEINTLGIHMKL